MNKILIVSHEPISANMAGPPIRMLELARALSRDFQVTLAAPNRADLPGESFATARYDDRALKSLAEDHRVVVIAGFIFPRYPFLRDVSASLALDVYDPIHFEFLGLHAGEKTLDQWNGYEEINKNFAEQMREGDFFLCASEAQRALWIGMLLANKRVNPATFAQDRTFRSLIDIVPYGLPGPLPVKKKNVLKGVYPGIGKDDFVVLWGGGIYDWLDPLTAVRAMALVRKRRPDVKLFFMGCKYPNPKVVMKSIPETIRLSDSLGLTGESVFFNDWVSYNDRADFLLESDVGISLHPESIETDFSYRSRILDYIWAELPIIATRGGALSDVVREKGMGFVVDYNDAEELAEKLLQTAGKDRVLEEFKTNIKTRRDDFSWDRAAEPLRRFCRNPSKRTDREFFSVKPAPGAAYYFQRARDIYAAKGGGQVLKSAFLFLARAVNNMVKKIQTSVSK